jgi:hypothetical protein
LTVPLLEHERVHEHHAVLQQVQAEHADLVILAARSFAPGA